MGCAAVPEYAHVDNPSYFIIKQNLYYADAIIHGGEYKQSATIKGRPAFHNTNGTAVSGRVSGIQLGSHVYIDDEGRVCFSSITIEMCPDYKPVVYKK